MKIRILCCLCLVALLLGGCSGNPQKGQANIVTTNFATYDWVMAILGDNPAGISVEILSDGGTDMHSYQPTAEDILAVQQASLFYYVGHTSESWVAGVLKTTGCAGKALVDVVADSLLCPEEHHHEGEEHHHDYDEHVWLSIKNAKKFVTAIFADIADLDGENRSYYEKNLNAYLGKLDALDSAYATAVAAGTKKHILFADRFPFLYLFSDYALPFTAAFSGCSSESDASFETISHLVTVINEKQLQAVMVLENSRQDIANAVIGATAGKNMEICKMNSMQSVTKEQIKAGVTYLSVMEENLMSLQKALK